MPFIPATDRTKKTAAIGAFNLFMAYQMYSWVPDMSGWVPALMALIGAGLIALTAWRYTIPRPSFAADVSGFSVMGKKKRSWDEYGGVKLRTLRIGFFPIGSWVIVKIGKSVHGSVHIKVTHLSAPVSDMAAEINAYAKHARRAQDLTLALAAIPATQLIGEGTQPTGRCRADPMAPAFQGGNSSPAQSVRTISERLFGRRKVI
ncbi:hypothetical protein [Octadecabacter antarcticus]|nr:hypothetical protein [Octadecabacter antarcticus]